MSAAKKAVKKIAGAELSIGTGSPNVVSQTETGAGLIASVPLVEVEFFEGKKVVSSELSTVNGVNVRDITVEGGITYRVNA